MAKPRMEYRVVKRRYHDKVYFIIMELWYNEKGEIEGWVDDPHPFGETVPELKKDLEKFKKAFSKGLLNYDDFSATNRIKSKFSSR